MTPENKDKTIIILQLYPVDMNIYGDWGNTLTLKRRSQWHGYKVRIIDYNPGDVFPQNVDIVVGGGGQDSGQLRIKDDLLKIGPKLHELAQKDTPMLLICGLYQLFGKVFKTKDNQRIDGIGLFDIETEGSAQRLTGNLVTSSEKFAEMVGYENHSGLTYLGDKVAPLGSIVKGAGNNGQDNTEGAIYKNCIGTYMHGSFLPKNPNVADWLIETAAINKYGEFTPSVIDDRFATDARSIAIKRPR